MRILHLVSYSLYSGPLPPTVGLALAQRALGHDVWLAYDVKRGAFNDFEEAAAPRLAGLGLEPPVSLTLSAKSSPLELWRDWRSLARWLAAGSADVVHAHLSHDHLVAAVARPRRAPSACVRSVHADRSLVRRAGQGWVHRHAEGWITRADAHREALLTAFALPPERVVTIPSGFDAAPLADLTPRERAAARTRFGIGADDFVVAQVALIADRGQLELVRALATMPEADRPTLLFAGRGEGEPALRAELEALGVGPWVRFAGYLAGPELRLAYAAADACFLARAGNDGSARAALEAMAAGVPLVASRAGALGELVTPARGWPVESLAPADLVAGLRAVRAVGDEARARAAAARRHVLEERSFALEAAATLELYGRALDARRKALG